MTTPQPNGSASAVAVARRFGRTGSVAFGVALVLAGGAAVFLSANAAGTVALIAAGVILIVLGAFGGRITNFKAAGVEVTLREVTHRLTEADEAEKRGEDERARTLRDEALRLASAADPIASEYERVRGEMPSGSELTSAMQEIVDRGHKLAKRPTLRRDDLKKLFDEGTDGKRITALAILQRRPDLANFDLLSAAVANPRSPFEHFQALQAVRVAIDGQRLTVAEVTSLREQVRVAFADGKLTGTDRARVADLILKGY